MTGRERVLATLNRRKPDVIAFDLGGTDCSSVHVSTYDKLRKCLVCPTVRSVAAA